MAPRAVEIGAVRTYGTLGASSTLFTAHPLDEGWALPKTKVSGSGTLTVERGATAGVLIAEPGSALGRLLEHPRAKDLFWAVVAAAAVEGAKEALKVGIEQVGAALAAAHIAATPVQPVQIDVPCPQPAIEQHEPAPPKAAPQLGPFADPTKT